MGAEEFIKKMEMDSSIFNDYINKSTRSLRITKTQDGKENMFTQNENPALEAPIDDGSKTSKVSSRVEKSANTFNDDIFMDIQRLIERDNKKGSNCLKNCDVRSLISAETMTKIYQDK